MWCQTRTCEYTVYFNLDTTWLLTSSARIAIPVTRMWWCSTYIVGPCQCTNHRQDVILSLPNLSTVNTRLADIPLLRTPAVTDEIQPYTWKWLPLLRTLAITAPNYVPRVSAVTRVDYIIKQFNVTNEYLIIKNVVLIFLKLSNVILRQIKCFLFFRGWSLYFPEEN